MLKDNFNIQRDMSSSEASLPGQQQWAAREVARLARDRAQGSPGRESTENIYPTPRIALFVRPSGTKFAAS